MNNLTPHQLAQAVKHKMRNHLSTKSLIQKSLESHFSPDELEDAEIESFPMNPDDVDGNSCFDEFLNADDSVKVGAGWIPEYVEKSATESAPNDPQIFSNIFPF